MVLVLDPTVQMRTLEDNPGPGPDAGSIRGRTVGFRLDTLWRSWDWVAEEWQQLLGVDGAASRTWRTPSRTEAEGVELDDDLGDFYDSVDVAIVGLGNCGSCTQWTILDAIAAANRGLPTVAIVTAQFEDIARTLSGLGGRPELRLCVLPYPFDVLPETEVRSIARELFPTVVDALGVRP
ncbi:MAG: hypothetical protein WCK21_00335 [Actinomycetota bacterium]